MLESWPRNFESTKSFSSLICFCCLLLAQLTKAQTDNTDDDEKKLSLWVLAGVGGLILLLIVFMVVIICLVYYRKREEKMRVIHVRAMEDWACSHTHETHHKTVIMESTGVPNTPRVNTKVQTSNSLASLRPRTTMRVIPTPKALTPPPPTPTPPTPPPKPKRTPRLKKVVAKVVERERNFPKPVAPPGIWLPHKNPVRTYLQYTITK